MSNLTTSLSSRLRGALLATFCAACLGLPVSAAGDGGAAAGRFPVIGYFPSWTGQDPALVPFGRLTHVFYSFINPTPAGGLTPADDRLLSQLVALGRKHGTKVGVAIGGWNNGNTSDWETMARRPRTRASFVRNVVEFCEQNRLDWVDIDWEYPNEKSARDYALLMKELGDALRKTGRGLSTAVIGSNHRTGQHILPEVFASLDYLNIMAYDFNWGAKGLSHSTLGAADTALDYWIGRGCPKAKAVLGVPFYGRNPEITYRELVTRDKEAPNKDRVGDFFYNGIPTMRAKTELALRKGGGIMIWELTQDTQDGTSLLRAIDETVKAYRGQAAR